MTQINLDDLPQSVLNQVPLSIQIEGPILELDDLPTDIKYLLQNYVEYTPTTINYNTVYDIEPTLSVYNDFKTVVTKKKLITDYFKNYLEVKVGQYPFDVLEGTRLKEHLQTRDTSLRRSLIATDINKAKKVLSQDYNIDIKINKTELIPYKMPSADHDSYVDMQINITLTIEDEDTTVLMI
jgi:hypothetical protein